jgi:hypothetical protein
MGQRDAKGEIQLLENTLPSRVSGFIQLWVKFMDRPLAYRSEWDYTICAFMTCFFVVYTLLI